MLTFELLILLQTALLPTIPTSSTHPLTPPSHIHILAHTHTHTHTSNTTTTNTYLAKLYHLKSHLFHLIFLEPEHIPSFSVLWKSPKSISFPKSSQGCTIPLHTLSGNSTVPKHAIITQNKFRTTP